MIRLRRDHSDGGDMAAKEILVKKYVVRLSYGERALLKR
jgi:hypothetical protein